MTQPYFGPSPLCTVTNNMASSWSTCITDLIYCVGFAVPSLRLSVPIDQFSVEADLTSDVYIAWILDLECSSMTWIFSNAGALGYLVTKWSSFLNCPNVAWLTRSCQKWAFGVFDSVKNLVTDSSPVMENPSEVVSAFLIWASFVGQSLPRPSDRLHRASFGFSFLGHWTSISNNHLSSGCSGKSWWAKISCHAELLEWRNNHTLLVNDLWYRYS